MLSSFLFIEYVADEFRASLFCWYNFYIIFVYTIFGIIELLQAF